MANRKRKRKKRTPLQILGASVAIRRSVREQFNRVEENRLEKIAEALAAFAVKLERLQQLIHDLNEAEQELSDEFDDLSATVQSTGPKDGDGRP